MALAVAPGGLAGRGTNSNRCEFLRLLPDSRGCRSRFGAGSLTAARGPTGAVTNRGGPI